MVASSKFIEKMCRGSLLFWVKEKKILNEKAKPIDFHKYYFLVALYTDRAKEIAIRKSSQTGVSTWAILRGIWHMKYWGINTIHTQPTSGDANKFVESKVNEIIRVNEEIHKSMDKESADSLKIKSIKKGYIFYQATFAEGQSFMITSDENIYDELDRSNINTVKNYKSRQEGESSLKQEIFISTPEIPKAGIDYEWNLSDQKHLRFNCPHCKYRQYFSWPESIDLEREVYVCKQCNGVIDNTKFPDQQKELDIRWEPKYPGRKRSGYWINQMMVPWKTAAELAQDYKSRKEKGELKYFFNHQMGMPYQDSSASVPESLFLQNIIQLNSYEDKPSYAGVDVQGNGLYGVIGNKKGVYGIFFISGDTTIPRGRPGSPWDTLDQYMVSYQIKVMVIDGGFRPNMVRAFADKHPYKVYVCWFKEDPKRIKISRWGNDKFDSKGSLEERTTVLVDRERAIDRTVSQLDQKKISFINYTVNEESLNMLIDHSAVMYKQTVTQADGETREEWEKTGQNDAFMGLVYFTVALEKA